MIDLVDRAVATLVKRHVLNGSSVQVSFEAPSRAWAARQNAPVLNVYLYDIREDLERRDVAFETTRDDEGRITARRAPPRRYALSYLITAWTQRPEDEHRLLSAMLGTFLRFESIPEDALEEPLADTGLPIYAKIAMPPADERSISDLWTALGGELKPSLDLVLTVPFDVERQAAVGPPVVEPMVSVAPIDGQPRAGRRGKVPPRRAAARERPVADAEEEVRSGTEEEPGRTLRVRALPQRWPR